MHSGFFMASFQSGRSISPFTTCGDEGACGTQGTQRPLPSLGGAEPWCPCPGQDRGDGCFAPSLVPSLLCHSLPDFVAQSLAAAPGTPALPSPEVPLTSNSSPSPDTTTNVSHCDRSSSRTFSCAWWGLSVGESVEIWSITLHPSALPVATPQTATPAPDGDPSQGCRRQGSHSSSATSCRTQSSADAVRGPWRSLSHVAGPRQDHREGRRNKRRKSCSWTHR